MKREYHPSVIVEKGRFRYVFTQPVMCDWDSAWDTADLTHCRVVGTESKPARVRARRAGVSIRDSISQDAIAFLRSCTCQTEAIQSEFRNVRIYNHLRRFKLSWNPKYSLTELAGED